MSLPRTWRDWTRVVIVASVVLIAAYDVVALIHGGYPATISKIIFDFSRSNPVAPFALGFLCGHLFWGQPTNG